MIFDKEQDIKNAQMVLGRGNLVFLASGEGEGDNAILDAVKKALDSPFVDNMKLQKGYGIFLVQVYSKKKINLHNYKDKKMNRALREALDFVCEKSVADADVIIQSSSCRLLKSNQIKVLIVGTGK